MNPKFIEDTENREQNIVSAEESKTVADKGSDAVGNSAKGAKPRKARASQKKESKADNESKAATSANSAALERTGVKAEAADIKEDIPAKKKRGRPAKAKMQAEGESSSEKVAVESGVAQSKSAGKASEKVSSKATEKSSDDVFDNLSEVNLPNVLEKEAFTDGASNDGTEKRSESKTAGKKSATKNKTVSKKNKSAQETADATTDKVASEIVDKKSVENVKSKKQSDKSKKASEDKKAEKPVENVKIEKSDEGKMVEKIVESSKTENALESKVSEKSVEDKMADKSTENKKKERSVENKKSEKSVKKNSNGKKTDKAKTMPVEGVASEKQTQEERVRIAPEKSNDIADGKDKEGALNTQKTPDGVKNTQKIFDGKENTEKAFDGRENTESVSNGKENTFNGKENSEKTFNSKEDTEKASNGKDNTKKPLEDEQSVKKTSANKKRGRPAKSKQMVEGVGEEKVSQGKAADTGKSDNKDADVPQKTDISVKPDAVAADISARAEVSTTDGGRKPDASAEKENTDVNESNKAYEGGDESQYRAKKRNKRSKNRQQKNNDGKAPEGVTENLPVAENLQGEKSAENSVLSGKNENNSVNPVKSEKPVKSDKPKKGEKSVKGKNLEKGEKPAKVENSEKSERPEKLENPEKLEKPVKLENPEVNKQADGSAVKAEKKAQSEENKETDGNAVKSENKEKKNGRKKKSGRNSVKAEKIDENAIAGGKTEKTAGVAVKFTDTNEKTADEKTVDTDKKTTDTDNTVKTTDTDNSVKTIDTDTAKAAGVDSAAKVTDADNTVKAAAANKTGKNKADLRDKKANKTKADIQKEATGGQNKTADTITQTEKSENTEKSDINADASKDENADKKEPSKGKSRSAKKRAAKKKNAKAREQAESSEANAAEQTLAMAENAEKQGDAQQKTENVRKETDVDVGTSVKSDVEADVSAKADVKAGTSVKAEVKDDAFDGDIKAEAAMAEENDAQKQVNEKIIARKNHVLYEIARQNFWSAARHGIEGGAFGGVIKIRRKSANLVVDEAEVNKTVETESKAPENLNETLNQNEVVITKKKVNDVIIEAFKHRDKWQRKDLIDFAMTQYGLSPVQLAERSSTSLATRYKSLTGSVVNEMLSQGMMEYEISEKREIRLVRTLEETQQQVNYRAEILIFLEAKPYSTRNEILNALCKKEEGEEKETSEDRNRKRGAIGTALRQLEDIGEVIKTRGSYSLKMTDKYPATPIGAHFIDIEKLYNDVKNGKLRRKQYEYRLKLAYMKAININGSVFMEILALKAVKTLFGEFVVRDALTAGPNDNGIDGIVDVIDPLGFKERILIQAKTRQKVNSSVTVKELREFTGVMQAYKGTKGVMATNASIHEEGKRFAAAVPNLTCIDKERLFAIALKHELGIVYDKDGVPFLDVALFINYSLGVEG